MRKTLLPLLLASLTACGTPAPSLKLHPRPPVCVQFDTSEVLFSYGSGVAREQTLQDLTKRIDRYLSQFLKDDAIAITKGMCRPDTDAVLVVRLDALEGVSNSKMKVFVGPIHMIQAQLKYFVSFKAPGGRVLLELEDARKEEGLDELADTVASHLTGWVARYY